MLIQAIEVSKDLLCLAGLWAYAIIIAVLLYIFIKFGILLIFDESIKNDCVCNLFFPDPTQNSIESSTIATDIQYPNDQDICSNPFCFGLRKPYGNTRRKRAAYTKRPRLPFANRSLCKRRLRT